MNNLKVTGNMTNIETAIQYGLIKTSEFVDDQLTSEGTELDESLELLIIKQVIDNFKKQSEQDDYIDFLDNVFNYIDSEYSLIEEHESNMPIII